MNTRNHPSIGRGQGLRTALAALLLITLATASWADVVEIIGPGGDGSHNFDSPFDLVVDGLGNVYTAGHNRIWKITPTGDKLILMGGEGDGAGNPLTNTRGIAIDAAGNLYVSAWSSDNAFKMTPGGVITEILDESGDGAGNNLDCAASIAVDSSGNVYVSGYNSYNVFKITPDGVITEILDGNDHTPLIRPYRIAIDTRDNVYIGTHSGNRVVKLTPGGEITDIINETGDGAGNSLNNPNSIAVDESDNVYVTGGLSQNAFKITPNGVITEIIDATGDGAGNAINGPVDIEVDRAGNVYVVAANSHNVFKITPEGAITKIIDRADGTDSPRAVAVDVEGNIYVAGHNSRNVYRIAPEATALPPGVYKIGNRGGYLKPNCRDNDAPISLGVDDGSNWYKWRIEPRASGGVSVMNVELGSYWFTSADNCNDLGIKQWSDLLSDDRFSFEITPVDGADGQWNIKNLSNNCHLFVQESQYGCPADQVTQWVDQLQGSRFQFTFEPVE